MKKITASIFLFLITFCFVLTGCSSANIGMPEDYLNVSSNGGFVVNIGNTMYFANAYNSYSSLQEAADNDGERASKYSIKRVGVEGSSQKTLIKDEEEKVKYETLINKIAAYETSNMFVVGEYLYFTSPNIHKNDSKEQDKYNTYEFELSTLFRIKLDGTAFKEIYTTETSSAKFYLTGGQKPTILVYDDSKIMQLNCFENATKLTTLVGDEDVKVKSTIFPLVQECELTEIYYTVDRSSESNLTGNIVKRLNLTTKETEELSGYSRNGETVTLVAYDSGRLFYTRSGFPNEEAALYSNDFTNGYASEQRHRFTTDGLDNNAELRVVCSTEYDVNVFVFEYNSKIYMQDLSATVDTAAVNIVSETSDIAFVDGTYVYYTTDAGIYRVSVLTKNIEKISDIATTQTEAIDFDGRYVYFYAKVEESEVSYLYRADIANAGDLAAAECIAELAEEDVKETEDDDNFDE